MKYSTWHERGTKENLSPRQESNPWPPEHRAGALSTELRELTKRFFPVSHLGNIVSSVSFCFQDAIYAYYLCYTNPSIRALAKILRARASEHSSNFREQFEQRPNFRALLYWIGPFDNPLNVYVGGYFTSRWSGKEPALLPEKIPGPRSLLGEECSAARSRHENAAELDSASHSSTNFAGSLISE